MLLVTGAAGKTGQAVIQALIAKGQAVRALVRRAEQAEALRALGVQETVVGDMRAAAALTRAAEGARAIYHICPNVSPEEVPIGQAVIAAARAAGVRRLVYHSVLHPQTPEMPHHWQKLQVEGALFQSGLDFTILQPAAYMQNVLAAWPAVVERGIYAVPYPVDTRLGMVDLADVAEAAAVVLTGDEHAGATYELAGPEVLSQTDIAAVLSGQLNRPVRAEPLPIAAWRAQAQAAGLGAYQIDALTKMFDYYARYGFWGNPRVLAHLIGRAPASFEAFVARAARP